MQKMQITKKYNFGDLLTLNIFNYPKRRFFSCLYHQSKVSLTNNFIHVPSETCLFRCNTKWEIKASLIKGSLDRISLHIRSVMLCHFIHDSFTQGLQNWKDLDIKKHIFFNGKIFETHTKKKVQQSARQQTLDWHVLGRLDSNSNLSTCQQLFFSFLNKINL